MRPRVFCSAIYGRCWCRFSTQERETLIRRSLGQRTKSSPVTAGWLAGLSQPACSWWMSDRWPHVGHCSVSSTLQLQQLCCPKSTPPTSSCDRLAWSSGNFIPAAPCETLRSGNLEAFGCCRKWSPARTGAPSSSFIAARWRSLTRLDPLPTAQYFLNQQQFSCMGCTVVWSRLLRNFCQCQHQYITVPATIHAELSQGTHSSWRLPCSRDFSCLVEFMEDQHKLSWMASRGRKWSWKRWPFLPRRWILKCSFWTQIRSTTMVAMLGEEKLKLDSKHALYFFIFLSFFDRARLLMLW